MFDVITIGGATRDVTFTTSRGTIIETPQDLTQQKKLCFEYEAKIYPQEVYFSFGGGAANTALGLVKFGLKVSTILRIGKDSNGAAIKKNLADGKVDISLIQEDEELKTAISFIIIPRPKTDHTIFVYRGANEKLKIKNEKLKTVIGNSKWLYLTSFSGNWQKNFREIVRLVKESKIKLAFNPGALQIKEGIKGLKDILRITDVFVVNKDEATELVLSTQRRHSLHKGSLTELMKIIHNFGPKIVVITDGINGAYVLKDKEVLHTPADSKKSVDTTGAGDAFGSGFLGGLILTKKVDRALKYGIINSGNVVGTYGAQKGLLNKKEIEKKIGRIKIKRL